MRTQIVIERQAANCVLILLNLDEWANVTEFMPTEAYRTLNRTRMHYSKSQEHQKQKNKILWRIYAMQEL
jgi:hypothetical protein